MSCAPARDEEGIIKHRTCWFLGSSKDQCKSCEAPLPPGHRCCEAGFGFGIPWSCSQAVNASRLCSGSLMGRLMCRAVPPCPRLLGHTWPHHSRLMPERCQPAQPRLRVSLSPQCLCLQADGRGLLHPVRVLAGRDLVEKVGQCPCVGPGAGGLKGIAHCSPSLPSLSHGPALCALGHLQLTGGEHPDKGFGEQGLVLGGAEAAVSPCVGRGVPAPHPPDPAPCFTATCSPAAARLSSSPSSACWSPRSC